MNLLLDTHVLLWALGDDKELKPAVRRAIVEPANAVYVSAASAWEIAIKAALGRLEVPVNVERWLPAHLAQAHFQELPVSLRHALAVQRLPAHHDDPFDRMLIAQAQIEKLTLVTRDRQIWRYDVKLLRA